MQLDSSAPTASSPIEIDITPHLRRHSQPATVDVPVHLRLHVDRHGTSVRLIGAGCVTPSGTPMPCEGRSLATMLFTDLVGSTGALASAGDGSWRRTLDDHDAVVHRHLRDHGGREVKNLGDGTLAVFDGPGRAIGCARSILDEVHGLGLTARAAIHAGEIEVRGSDIMGLAVHIGSRLVGLARPDEILVSAVIPALVAGSEHRFEDRGDHDLRGVPGRWRLHCVA